jgi:two-component system OmpR family response regulator
MNGYCMKLLIIEDNQLLAASLKTMFKPSFIVDIAHTGAQGIELAGQTAYSAIMLDLGLPDIPGEEVCAQLRKDGVMTPILIATGSKETARCVQLLDTGADDYITKPYDTSILQARIRALLRRSSTLLSTEQITVADLVICPASRHVERGGIPVPLRKKEFDILEYLARNRGRPVTRTMILDHVWETGRGGWNNTVDVHIKYLRDKIDKPFDRQLIKTAHGIGYMLDG